MYDEKTLEELLQMKLEERRQELLASVEEEEADGVEKKVVLLSDSPRTPRPFVVGRSGGC